MTHLEILLTAYDEIGINYQVTVDEYSSSCRVRLLKKGEMLEIEQ